MELMLDKRETTLRLNFCFKIVLPFDILKNNTHMLLLKLV